MNIVKLRHKPCSRSQGSHDRNILVSLFLVRAGRFEKSNRKLKAESPSPMVSSLRLRPLQPRCDDSSGPEALRRHNQLTSGSGIRRGSGSGVGTRGKIGQVELRSDNVLEWSFTDRLSDHANKHWLERGGGQPGYLGRLRQGWPGLSAGAPGPGAGCQHPQLPGLRAPDVRSGLRPHGGGEPPAEPARGLCQHQEQWQAHLLHAGHAGEQIRAGWSDDDNILMKVGRDASGWTGSGEKQLKKMMDMPALSEVDWTRNDISQHNFGLFQKYFGSVQNHFKLVHVLLYYIFVQLFWNDITIFWDENIVYFFNWEKKLFWTNNKFFYLIFINKLSWYHPKISYENIAQKDINKFQICRR